MPKQKTDISNSTDPAISFTAPGQTWKILEEVVVASETYGVNSNFDNSKLINKGEVIGEFIGAYFFGVDNGTILNKTTGDIVGKQGVTVNGGQDTTVKNEGGIFSYGAGGVYAVDASNFEFLNTGKVFGATSGVHIELASVAVTKGAMIDNDGKISGTEAGVWIETNQPGLDTKIINGPDGIIEGGNYSIKVDEEKLSLVNKGKLKGDVEAFGGAADKVINAGQIEGDVFLGDGNDTYKNKGGKAGMIFSHDGNDTLVAGSSKDQFAFGGPINAATNVDRVKKFESGKDKFIFDKSTFTALTGTGGLKASEFHKGSAAADADDYIIYRKGTGELFYDPDGLGGATHTKIAQLDAGQNLKAGDFTVLLLA